MSMDGLHGLARAAEMAARREAVIARQERAMVAVGKVQAKAARASAVTVQALRGVQEYAKKSNETVIMAGMDKKRSGYYLVTQTFDNVTHSTIMNGETVTATARVCIYRLYTVRRGMNCDIGVEPCFLMELAGVEEAARYVTSTIHPETVVEASVFWEAYFIKEKPGFGRVTRAWEGSDDYVIDGQFLAPGPVTSERLRCGKGDIADDVYETLSDEEIDRELTAVYNAKRRAERRKEKAEGLTIEIDGKTVPLSDAVRMTTPMHRGRTEHDAIKDMETVCAHRMSFMRAIEERTIAEEDEAMGVVAPVAPVEPVEPVTPFTPSMLFSQEVM